MTKIYCVMADAIAYVEADSEEEATAKAELLDASEWDIENSSTCEENATEI